MLVAGKTYQFADKKMAQLLGWCRPYEWYFEAIERWVTEDRLAHVLEQCRTGRYKTFVRGFPQVAKIDPATVSVPELERIPGYGMKSSRFFVLWSRPWERYAALDVHILRWMRGRGYDAPVATPSSKKRYRALEAAFIEEADRRGVRPRTLDMAIWMEAASHPERSEYTKRLVES